MKAFNLYSRSDSEAPWIQGSTLFDLEDSGAAQIEIPEGEDPQNPSNGTLIITGLPRYALNGQRIDRPEQDREYDDAEPVLHGTIVVKEG